MSRYFSGTTTDYLTLSTPVDTAAPVTIAAWVYPTNFYSYGCPVAIGGNNLGNEHCFSLMRNGSTPIALCQAGPSPQIATATASMSVNNWYHLAAVFTSSTSRAILLNGGNKGTNSGSMTPNPTYMYRTNIGTRANESWLHPWWGYIAEVSIWNTAQSDANILDMASNYKSGLFYPDYLVLHARLVSTEDYDEIGDRTFSIIGSPGTGGNPPIVYPSKYNEFTQIQVI